MDKDPQSSNDLPGEPKNSPGAAPPRAEVESKVVYRRPNQTEGETQQPERAEELGSIWTRELAPAVMPVVIGFMLLLILISVLGFLSVRRMDEVSVAVLSLEQQHATKLSLLLQLRLALTRLDNEARARAESEARDELRPPIDLRLSNARDKLKDLLPQIEHLPLAANSPWLQFKNDLTELY